MYCGNSPDNKVYRKWDRGEVEPLLVYKEKNFTDNFFPAFLLLAIKSGKGNSLIPGFGTPGNKEDWLAWLDDIFLPEHNICALASVVCTNNLPPIDVWVSLPYPDSEQGKFGPVFGQQLSFTGNTNREFALKWWINRFMARWNSKIKGPGLERYLKLRGFYWARETMTLKDRLLLPRLIAYVHRQGLQSMWIPYFAAAPFLSIINPGFDITIIQPSYMQNPSYGWQRLAEAAAKAKKYNAGLEIEFDTSVLFENSEGYKIALDYLNRGLPDFEGYMNHTFMAYYTGYKTVVELCKNRHPLYTHLYHFVKGTLQKVEYPGIKY